MTVEEPVWCKNCQNFSEILRIEEKQFILSDDLSILVLKLQKRSIYLESYIDTLEKKLSNLSNLKLVQDIKIVADVVSAIEKKLAQNSKSLTNNNTIEKVNFCITRLKNSIITFEDEKSSFWQKIKQREEELLDNVNFLQNMSESYRNNFFDEMNKCNQLKRKICEKLQLTNESTKNYITKVMDVKEKQLMNELKSRYQHSLQNSDKQIKKQQILIKKLQNHRGKLYLIIKEERERTENLKKNHENEILNLKQKIESLRQYKMNRIRKVIGK